MGSNTAKTVLITGQSPEGGRSFPTIDPPIGLAYLAAALEASNFECKIIDTNVFKLTNNEVVDSISPDTALIGFYLYSFNYTYIQELVASCRGKYPNATIVLGGPLPSAVPASILEDFKCNGLVRGEGENAIVKLATHISEGKPAFDSTVDGAVYRDNESGEVVYNGLQRLKDLDQLHFPAYHLLPELKYYSARARHTPAAAIITSRGCTFDCTFCSKDVYERRVTYRSPENVLLEVDQLVKKYGIRQLNILDDNFAQNKKRVEIILEGLIERNYKLSINLPSGVRAELLDEPLLVKMKKAGIYKIAYGIESGDPEVLRLSNKKLDVQKVIEVQKYAKRLGFETTGFFIIGLPGETDAGFQQTMQLAKDLQLDSANFCMALPFVGTELYRMIEKEGRFLVDTSRNIETGFYAGKVHFEYGDSKAPEILVRYKLAYRTFYNWRHMIKLVLNLKSWNELLWYFKAFLFLVKGFLPINRAKAKSVQ